MLGFFSVWFYIPLCGVLTCLPFRSVKFLPPENETLGEHVLDSMEGRTIDELIPRDLRSAIYNTNTTAIT